MEQEKDFKINEEKGVHEIEEPVIDGTVGEPLVELQGESSGKEFFVKNEREPRTIYKGDVQLIIRRREVQLGDLTDKLSKYKKDKETEISELLKEIETLEDLAEQLPEAPEPLFEDIQPVQGELEHEPEQRETTGNEAGNEDDIPY